MQTFTLWMGVTICELVSKFVPVLPGVKWPNDIVFGARKAGGMLTEARVDADEIRDMVFGLGLNVNSPASDWPSELSRRAVSLSELAGVPIDLNRLTAALIGRVLLAYERFTDGDHVDLFAELWNKHDVLRGREVTLVEGTRKRRGKVLGVDDVGSLLLRDDHGHTRGFRAGEVTVEKDA
jgi:BirA family biotin operon repressor/biotin-[acetyl-CoA-carboxylase] ligase